MFETMLDTLYNNLELKKENSKIILPEPLLIKSGHKTVWKNSKDFLRLFNRHPDDFTNYINKETTTKINWISDSKSDGCIFQSKIKKDYVYELMKKYISDRIMCKGCKSLDTLIIKNQELRKHNFKCCNCNNELYI